MAAGGGSFERFQKCRSVVDSTHLYSSKLSTAPSSIVCRLPSPVCSFAHFPFFSPPPCCHLNRRTVTLVVNHNRPPEGPCAPAAVAASLPLCVCVSSMLAASPPFAFCSRQPPLCSSPSLSPLPPSHLLSGSVSLPQFCSVSTSRRRRLLPPPPPPLHLCRAFAFALLIAAR